MSNNGPINGCEGLHNPLSFPLSQVEWSPSENVGFYPSLYFVTFNTLVMIWSLIKVSTCRTESLACVRNAQYEEQSD